MHHEHGTDERDPITGQRWGSEGKIETKEFFRTSEFGILVVVGLGITIAAAVTVTIDALSAAQLIAFLAFAYIISRGLAKSGTAHPYTGRERLDLRERFAERSQGQQPDPQQQAYPQQPAYAQPPQPATPPPQPAYPTEPIPQPAQAPNDPGYGPGGTVRQSPPSDHPAGQDRPRQ